jgi:hypothetical protein
MSKIFFPSRSTMVEASPPHPGNTMYKVSKGIEHWGDTSCEVIKIQMVYDGKVSGRRSPSFPIDQNGKSKDFEKIKDVILNL